ncbi:hypothetical protein [Mucilaginibacter arboris]
MMALSLTANIRCCIIKKLLQQPVRLGQAGWNNILPNINGPIPGATAFIRFIITTAPRTKF